MQFNYKENALSEILEPQFQHSNVRMTQDNLYFQVTQKFDQIKELAAFYPKEKIIEKLQNLSKQTFQIQDNQDQTIFSLMLYNLLKSNFQTNIDQSKEAKDNCAKLKEKNLNKSKLNNKQNQINDQNKENINIKNNLKSHQSYLDQIKALEDKIQSQNIELKNQQNLLRQENQKNKKKQDDLQTQKKSIGEKMNFVSLSLLQLMNSLEKKQILPNLDHKKQTITQHYLNNPQDDFNLLGSLHLNQNDLFELTHKDLLLKEECLTLDSRQNNDYLQMILTQANTIENLIQQSN